jgi:ATP-binding cassette subfamily B protein
MIRNSNHSQYDLLGEIEFRKVTFTYPENNVTALQDVSFKIARGQSLGITGQVGSGKSSLLALLTRLYDVNSGSVLVDGRDIREHNLHLYRKNCGVVPQEVFLFSDTVANNISFGSPGGKADMAQVEEAAKLAGVHHNILGFPDQYQTLVGERGVTLSGGQKQRISIARAIINRPRMMYLDDCLSAVDVETEDLILRNLRDLMKDRTSIIISHRVSSLRDADQILYLDQGRVVERGTHDELLALNGRYAALNKLQSH